jgi:hypothetical protein
MIFSLFLGLSLCNIGVEEKESREIFFLFAYCFLFSLTINLKYAGGFSHAKQGTLRKRRERRKEQWIRSRQQEEVEVSGVFVFVVGECAAECVLSSCSSPSSWSSSSSFN